MKVVIDIPKYVYDTIIACDGYISDCDNEKVGNAIKNGALLPKEHGRLIDADEFHRTLEDMPIRDNDKWFNWLQKACNR